MANPMHSSKFVLAFSLWLGFVTGVLDSWASKATVIPYLPDLAWIYPLLFPVLFACVGLAVVALVRIARSRNFYWAFFLLLSLSLFDLGASLFLHPFSVHVIVMVLVVSVAGGLISARVMQNHQEVARFVVLRSAILFVIYAAGCAAFPWLQHLREDRIITSVSSAASAPLRPPNVLLIIVDTLRADHLTEYGYSRATSPNSSALAKRGVLFEDAIATAPWTLPSHASMMTGLYPTEHGAVDLQSPLSSGFVTIGEALEQRGYTTAAFSANSGLFSRRFGFGRGFMHFNDYGNTAYRVLQTPLALKVQKTLAFMGLQRDIPGRQSAAEVNTHALLWLDRYPHQPFFVTLNYFDVHFPYLPPPGFANRFSSGKALPQAGADVDAWLHSLKPAEVQQEKDAYDSAIAYVDAQLGVLMGELQRRQFLENTIIVFTSDHGEGLGEHGFMNHGNSLYRELIHVPLIIVDPGKMQAGLRVTQPIGLAALPATLLAMVDTRSNPFRGPALTALWDGHRSRVQWPDPISQLEARPEKAAWLLNHESSMDSIVSADWHLITGGKRTLELFDRARDAAEVASVAHKPGMKPVVDTLQAGLERTLGAPGAYAPPASPYFASREKVMLPPSGDQSEIKKLSLKYRRRRKIQELRKSRKASSDELLRALGYVP